ncbi:MAG: prepilin-type N-terminal cleavage/methylation domain-containing protein [Persicimonas sp.]
MDNRRHNSAEVSNSRNARTPRPFPTGRAPGGFTLIEVLLAVMLLSMLTAISWVGVANMFDTRDWMTDRFERFQIMRVAMDRMAREVSSAYVAGPSHGGEELPGEEAENEGDEDTMARMLTEPVQFGMIGRDDELHFTNFAHVRSLAGEKASHHAEIGYFTQRDRDPDTGEMVLNLMRREDTSLDDDITDGGTIYLLVPDIEGVEFEYWDPGPVEMGTMEEMAEGRWQDSWDTTRREHAGRLPTRVRMTVTLTPQDPRGNEEVFTIQTQIETSEVMEF